MLRQFLLKQSLECLRIVLVQMPMKNVFCAIFDNIIFIDSVNSDTLRNFLRFVTGSTVCSSTTIEVMFNSLSESA